MARKFKDGEFVKIELYPGYTYGTEANQAYHNGAPLMVTSLAPGIGYNVLFPSGITVSIRTKHLGSLCTSTEDLHNELKNQNINAHTFFKTLIGIDKLRSIA